MVRKLRMINKRVGKLGVGKLRMISKGFGELRMIDERASKLRMINKRVGRYFIYKTRDFFFRILSQGLKCTILGTVAYCPYELFVETSVQTEIIKTTLYCHRKVNSIMCICGNTPCLGQCHKWDHKHRFLAW